MTIQPIDERSIVLYITRTDLHAHGLTPRGLTMERALSLARDAFRDSGVELEGPLEIEAYPDEEGVLVFAHVQPPPQLWLSFGDIEQLLSALHAIPFAGEESALSWWEDRYWLALPPGRTALHAALSEYGRSESLSPQRAARLEEYGIPILERDAAAALLRYFPSLKTTPSTLDSRGIIGI